MTEAKSKVEYLRRIITLWHYKENMNYIKWEDLKDLAVVLSEKIKTDYYSKLPRWEA